VAEEEARLLRGRRRIAEMSTDEKKKKEKSIISFLAASPDRLLILA